MKLKRLFQFLIIASLLMTGVGSTPHQAFAAKAQPLLTELAAQDPSQTVRVIVQKMAGTTGAEAQVAKLGGTVTQDLHVINAFAAEMTAEAAVKLSRSESVRWVSLDAPTQSSASSNKFTTWASSTGAYFANGFTNSSNMLGLAGPNKSYGYGANVKGAFGGLSVEFSPMTSITKVEVALKLYTPSILGSKETPKVYVVVGGIAGKSVVIPVTTINGHTSEYSAVTPYVDITATRVWKWSDFKNNLQVVIDQSLVASTHPIYYDAVGLRITTGTGTDTTSPLGVTTSSDGTTVDTSVMMNVFPKVVRATDVWNTAPYYKGAGVTVAVIDSGNFKTNGLGTRMIGQINFNSAEHTASDKYGHGTHVTGIIADDGSSSGNQYMGIALKANVIGLRVADDIGMAYESDVIAAMQWVYDNRTTYNIRVVNLSLNSSVYEPYDTSPLDAAAEILWFNSVVVVVSAGNNGSATLYAPANDPFVITVGATDDKTTLDKVDDIVTTFSAYGLDDLGHPKPDLVAPGRNIIAYLPDVGSLTIPVQHPEGVVNSTYFRMSGTSMAAPVVSGAIALLLESNPNLTPDQVKYRLMNTANKNWPGYNTTTAGAGYLDIYAAVTTNTTASANSGLKASNLLSTGSTPITWGSVGWNSVGWNSVGWNSVGWNSVGWNSVGWNSDYWGP